MCLRNDDLARFCFVPFDSSLSTVILVSVTITDSHLPKHRHPVLEAQRQDKTDLHRRSESEVKDDAVAFVSDLPRFADSTQCRFQIITTMGKSICMTISLCAVLV